MFKSRIFHTDEYKRLEKRAKDILVAQFASTQVGDAAGTDSLVNKTINNPRAFGDAVENIFSEKFETILGNLHKEFTPKFERRAMADFAFTDRDGLYYAVDVKTHRLDTKFNMPNLTSVKRLSEFYENDENFFVVLKVDYTIDCSKVLIENVTLVPVEFISWNCLTIGALGVGQIQIANANKVIILPENKRKNWMIEMCDKLGEFYPKEISKINNRQRYFEEIKKRWQEKAD